VSSRFSLFVSIFLVGFWTASVGNLMVGERGRAHE